MSDTQVAGSTAERGPRERLVNATIELMATEGSTGWTLRRLAQAIGTSHRMVIYHFGSFEGLLVAVVEEVERRQRERRRELSTVSDPGAAARTMWRELSDPAIAPYERLFFELYAAGLQGRGAAASLSRASVDEWLGPLEDLFADATGDPAQAATDARLGLAVVRGLLLDLLATGDAEGTAAAHERYLTLYPSLCAPEEPALRVPAPDERLVLDFVNTLTRDADSLADASTAAAWWAQRSPVPPAGRPLSEDDAARLRDVRAVLHDLFDECSPEALRRINDLLGEQPLVPRLSDDGSVRLELGIPAGDPGEVVVRLVIASLQVLSERHGLSSVAPGGPGLVVRPSQ